MTFSSFRLWLPGFYLVLSRVLWSLLVILSIAACLLSAGSRSVLFKTTTMRGQVSSPISRHSAVCVCTPFTTSTTSIIRSMIWAPAGETPAEIVSTLRTFGQTSHLRTDQYLHEKIWLRIWKHNNTAKPAAWGSPEANSEKTLPGRKRGAQNNIKTRSEMRGGGGTEVKWRRWRLGAGNWSCRSLVVFPLPLFFSWLWHSSLPELHSHSLHLASRLSSSRPTWETRGSWKHTKISILSFLANPQHVPPAHLPPCAPPHPTKRLI